MIRPILRGLCVAAALAAMAASAAAEEVATVRIHDYRFDPAKLRIKAGSSVRWLNDEKRASHSVLILGEGRESERLFPGEHYTRRFDTPGRYPYSCGPHPEMHGEIEVEP